MLERIEPECTAIEALAREDLGEALVVGVVRDDHRLDTADAVVALLRRDL